MALGLLLMGSTTRSVPPLPMLAMAVVAIALAGMTGLFVKLERRCAQCEKRRHLLMLAVVGLPMALFGLSVAGWMVNSDKPDWESAISVLVALGMLSSTVLSGRMASKIAAMISLWLGLAVLAGSTVSYAIVGISLAVGIYLAVRQSRLVSAEAERQREISRAQHRAEELLAEYEQSGQGWFWETDRRGMIAYVSPTIGKLLGRDNGSLVGRPLTELFICGWPLRCKG